MYEQAAANIEEMKNKIFNTCIKVQIIMKLLESQENNDPSI